LVPDTAGDNDKALVGIPDDKRLKNAKSFDTLRDFRNIFLGCIAVSLELG
jgi:hypothetical protein